MRMGLQVFEGVQSSESVPAYPVCPGHTLSGLLSFADGFKT